MSFTWIPYYKEFAQRLTQFQKDRKRLLNLIYDNRDELLAKYLHDQGGEGDLLEDIDPFTVFGLFNRGIKHENRINSAKLFKNILDIKADIPKDFEGIPVLNNQKSHFFGFRYNKGKKHCHSKEIYDAVFHEGILSTERFLAYAESFQKS